jgi:hypothetical protein
MHRQCHASREGVHATVAECETACRKLVASPAREEEGVLTTCGFNSDRAKWSASCWRASTTWACRTSCRGRARQPIRPRPRQPLRTSGGMHTRLRRPRCRRTYSRRPPPRSRRRLPRSPPTR